MEHEQHDDFCGDIIFTYFDDLCIVYYFEAFSATRGVIYCSETNDDDKVVCCQTEYDNKGNVVAQWCTTCDHTNPPSNCTPREKQTTEPNPGRELSTVLQGGVFKDPNTIRPELQQEEDEKTGGVFEEPESNNTFSENE